MADTNQKLRIETEPSEGFLLSGKLMLGAVIILAVTVVFVVGFHIYARWYIAWARRRQLETRRQRGGHRIRNVLNGANIRHEDRGLERSVLSSLPVFLYSDKSQSAEEPPLDCAVCLSDFEGNDIVRHLPKCNHSFHIDCIDMWFRSHSTCPICRSRVQSPFRPVWNRVESDFTMVHGLPLSWRTDKGSINTNATSTYRDESNFTMDHGLPLALRSNVRSTMNINNPTSNREESNSTAVHGLPLMWRSNHNIGSMNVNRTTNQVKSDFTMVHGLPLRLRSDKGSININTNATTSSTDERKGVESTEAQPHPPPRRAESDNELTPGEGLIRPPGTRFLSLKRMLSMNRKSTNGGDTTSRNELNESVHEVHPPTRVDTV